MNTESKHPHFSPGFTMVEVAVVIPILLAISLILFNILFAMINASSAQREQIDMSYDRQTAMTLIENDTILTSQFLPAIDSSVTDPYPPSSNGGAWSYLGESSTIRALILRAYSTSTNPMATDRQPVFKGDPSGTACNASNKYLNDVQSYDIIYFVKNGNLFRRRLVDTATAVCDPGQYQKLSCPSLAELSAQGISTRNSSCAADDEIVATNVINFTVIYYGDKTSTTALDVYNSGSDLLASAVDAEVSLTISRRAGGKTLSSTSTLRMSKLNTSATDSTP